MGIYNLSTEKTRSLVSDFEKSRSAHIDWLNRFNKQLICGVSDNSVNVNHRQCSFAEFYYSVNEELLLNYDVFRKIEETHKYLHKIASRIIEKSDNNQVITTDDYDLFISTQSEFMHEQEIIYSFIQETHHSMDKLTQLPNKGFMYTILEKEYAKLEREKVESSLVFADIDYFKKINDNYGHAFGDKVLKIISKILLEDLREYDTASRFGGEEFLIFLNHVSPQTAKIIIERTRLRISEMDIHLENSKIPPVTCSFGISAFTLNNSLEKNINNSDIALYSAKEKGRNRVEVYNE